MPLDVHIAASLKKAETKRRDMFLDEKLHELLFTKYRSIVEQTRFVSRLSNYYGDFEFNGAGVSSLGQDALDLAAVVSEPALARMLRDLADLCARAARAEENIYLFGD